MKIECPACAYTQALTPTVCAGCNKSFAGHLFRKYRKPLMSATTALVVGGYGGYKVTDKLHEEVRYPLRAEYALVEVCVNASAVPLPLRELERKRNVCLCAFEKASHDVSYESYRKEPETFVRSFRNHVAHCS